MNVREWFAVREYRVEYFRRRRIQRMRFFLARFRTGGWRGALCRLIARSCSYLDPEGRGARARMWLISFGNRLSASMEAKNE